jgi:hypothetical protein
MKVSQEWDDVKMTGCQDDVKKHLMFNIQELVVPGINILCVEVQSLESNGLRG